MHRITILLTFILLLNNVDAYKRHKRWVDVDDDDQQTRNTNRQQTPTLNAQPPSDLNGLSNFVQNLDQGIGERYQSINDVSNLRSLETNQAPIEVNQPPVESSPVLANGPRGGGGGGGGLTMEQPVELSSPQQLINEFHGPLKSIVGEKELSLPPIEGCREGVEGCQLANPPIETPIADTTGVSTPDQAFHTHDSGEITLQGNIFQPGPSLQRVEPEIHQQSPEPVLHKIVPGKTVFLRPVQLFRKPNHIFRHFHHRPRIFVIHRRRRKYRPVHVCETTDCKNGGSCTVVNDKVRCLCLRGFKGLHCEETSSVYTSIAHMEPLLDIEGRLVKIAREYLQKERRRLGEFKQFAKSVEDAMELSKDEPLKYLGNPINSYLIIKRFTSGWRELTSRLEIDDSKVDEMKSIIESNKYQLPTYEIDLLGATGSIIRLQDTYELTAREISDGKIKGISRSAHQMTAEDCIHIAEYAQHHRRYIRMEEWAKEAERIFDDPSLSHRIGNVSRLAVYEILGWTAYLSNDLPTALKYTKLVLEIEPNNDLALKNEYIYAWHVENNEKSIEDEATWMQMAKIMLESYGGKEYVQACRKVNPKPVKIKDASKLVCFLTKDSPLLLLKPIRTTRVHDNPEVLIFHNILSDKEMTTLKKLATPYLRQAKVVEGDITEANYRIAKTMFLQENFPGVKKINTKLNRRFEAMTGLNTDTAEQLQINNYGLGGQYEFHHDHGEEGSLLANHPDGNRLATLLVYLTDVERGGETVFTRLGISVSPNKGDAVFWYNLFRNGQGIDDTLHASCPVISGSKWVANKWFHNFGNEFRRKCLLREDI
uniref:procollagen-proline 4-dioxygenase n=1 Tax=Clytia hemisphaerica TaxID=252671 RepID=A0A7M5XCK6_9CNID